jgi:hypothetical protein
LALQTRKRFSARLGLSIDADAIQRRMTLQIVICAGGGHATVVDGETRVEIDLAEAVEATPHHPADVLKAEAVAEIQKAGAKTAGEAAAALTAWAQAVVVPE